MVTTVALYINHTISYYSIHSKYCASCVENVPSSVSVTGDILYRARADSSWLESVVSRKVNLSMVADCLGDMDPCRGRSSSSSSVILMPIPHCCALIPFRNAEM